MRRTKELIANDWFCFGTELTHNYVQQSRSTTHLQCLIMSNFSSPGQCCWNCFHSRSFLLTLLRSSSVALTHCWEATESWSITPEAVLWPSLHLCWAPSLVRVRPRHPLLLSGPGPKSSSQTCSACILCSTAASKRGLVASFLVWKIPFSLNSS